MTFSSHNVYLPDGQQTAPGLPLVRDADSYKAAAFAINSMFAPDDRPNTTLADLGCLEGGHSYEFALQGYDVTGFEARRANYLNAREIQKRAKLDNLRFVQGDVREELDGLEFDVVFCSGLLYHLDEPVSFLKLLGRVTRHLLVLNTHYSLQGGHSEASHGENSWCQFGDFENEGRHGHWFYESVTRWDSVGNRRSFWLQKQELIDCLLEDAGFYQVSEIAWQGATRAAHVPGGAGYHADRGMFTAVKA